MRNASGHQSKNERQQKKSEQDHIQHFRHKTCNWEVFGSFTLLSCKTAAKKCTKKCATSEKFFFLLIRPIFCFCFVLLFFLVFIAVAVAVWLALHDFIFCFSKL